MYIVQKFWTESPFLFILGLKSKLYILFIKYKFKDVFLVHQQVVSEDHQW